MERWRALEDFNPFCLADLVSAMQGVESTKEITATEILGHLKKLLGPFVVSFLGEYAAGPTIVPQQMAELMFQSLVRLGAKCQRSTAQASQAI